MCSLKHKEANLDNETEKCSLVQFISCDECGVVVRRFCPYAKYALHFIGIPRGVVLTGLFHNIATAFGIRFNLRHSVRKFYTYLINLELCSLYTFLYSLIITRLLFLSPTSYCGLVCSLSDTMQGKLLELNQLTTCGKFPHTVSTESTETCKLL